MCANGGWPCPAFSTEPRPDHAGYIADWLTFLKGKKAIFTAASMAQPAADWLMGEYQTEAITPAAALAA
ncbi:MAG: hypothetical protein EHM42_08270 [Planctomycetaceae bacterium]|nr:MAG: hypothetical protein EHM42_08270 [Planctomycetaceae bacterium]